MGCTSHAPRRSDTAVCSGVGAAVVGGDGRRVGGEGGGDGTIVLGETDEWVCEARYHAKQHEKRRKTKLAK